MTPRSDILSLLDGEKFSSPPAFSGLIHVTLDGLQSEGLALQEVHHEPQKMARAAASTFKLTGMPSAALPLDLCLPAEMLGAELNYEGEGFPQVRRAVFESTRDITTVHTDGPENLRRGRLQIASQAIRLVRGDIGKEVVISGIIPGPYTLLLYLCNPKNLFVEMKKEPHAVIDALVQLSDFLAGIGHAYREAGADFITIHEMGGSPGFIGPAKFEQFVQPALKALHSSLPGPRVLSVCGNTNKSLDALAGSGAEAVSVDHLADLHAARGALKDVLLFGNVDPVAALYRGDKAGVVEAVQGAKEAGVDAVWPGCDLVLQSPLENIRILVE
jgi:[methyl-Co(III) methanol-specific corrinoid protein]:coenzyme M methyltransferase